MSSQETERVYSFHLEPTRHPSAWARAGPAAGSVNMVVEGRWPASAWWRHCGLLLSRRFCYGAAVATAPRCGAATGPRTVDGRTSDEPSRCRSKSDVCPAAELRPAVRYLAICGVLCWRALAGPPTRNARSSRRPTFRPTHPRRRQLTTRELAQSFITDRPASRLIIAHHTVYIHHFRVNTGLVYGRVINLDRSRWETRSGTAKGAN